MIYIDQKVYWWIREEYHVQLVLGLQSDGCNLLDLVGNSIEEYGMLGYECLKTCL